MNKTPNIIIVEGIWGAGKSTAIGVLAKHLNAIVIPEPDHRTSNISGAKEIDQWYANAHLKNMSRAIRHAEKGRNVLIERSIMSSIAFSSVYRDGNIFEAETMMFREQLQRAHKKHIICSVIYLAPRETSTTLAHIKKTEYLLPFAQRSSLKRMDRTLKKIIKEYFP